MNGTVLQGLVKPAVKAVAFAGLMLSLASGAMARDVQYSGNETEVYVKPGEPLQVTFPGKVEGGFKRKNSSVSLEKQDNYLIVFAQPTLSLEGENLIVHLQDKRTYALRVMPATGTTEKDTAVNIIDNRTQEADVEETATPGGKRPPFAPTNAVSGLMREMILVSEFGKKKGIPGYHRSNKYSGETVMNDGTIEAKIDEIFMGTDLWGYVLTVNNLMDTGQRINPATFRMDGTRAVGAERWELAPKPLTPEQKLANAHQSKVYVITKAKRR